MALIYDAAQVLGCVKQPSKPWEFEGRKGTVHTAKLAVFGTLGGVAEITLKATSEEELVKKVSQYTPGKPAKVPISEIEPMYLEGRNKPSGYALVS
jgi:hypothetical protein